MVAVAEPVLKSAEKQLGQKMPPPLGAFSLVSDMQQGLRPVGRHAAEVIRRAPEHLVVGPQDRALVCRDSHRVERGFAENFLRPFRTWLSATLCRRSWRGPDRSAVLGDGT
jgi:hypothetical protein